MVYCDYMHVPVSEMKQYVFTIWSFGNQQPPFRVSPTPWSRRSSPPVFHQNQNSTKIRERK